MRGTCHPAHPGGRGRKQDEGESQISKQPAQAAHHACRPPLSGRVACPPPASPPFSPNTHGRETGPSTRGASWHPVKLAARHAARAASQQALPLAPAPPARRPLRSKLAARQPAPRGLSGERGCSRQTGRGRRAGEPPQEGDPEAGQLNGRQRKGRWRGGKLRHRPGRYVWLHGPQDTHTPATLR